jgi:predicted RNA-binding Zn-ribbon protein involved in translation (DUF1610 family)
MIKAKEIAMAEYKCPKCGGEKIVLDKKTGSGSKLVFSKKLIVVLCADCGNLLGIVNDLTDMEQDIQAIKYHLRV